MYAQLLGTADAHMLIVLLLLIAAVVAIAERVGRKR